MSTKFFSLYRKRGFSLTLELLNEFDEGETKETEFFAKLKENDSYLNEFYRVKKSLLENGLIAYKLNEDYDKVIQLTEIGKEVLKKIEDIESLLVKIEKN